MFRWVGFIGWFIGAVAAGRPSGNLEGLSGDLLVETMVTDCKQPAPARRFKAPDGYSYDYQCHGGVPRKVRRLDETSRERVTFELLPSLLDGQWLLRAAPAAGPCGSGKRAHHINTQVGWGKLSANCN